MLTIVVSPLDAITNKLSEALISAHYTRRRRRASSDPQWAAIEARREVPGNPQLSAMLSEDLTWDDWDTQRDIEETLTPTPWWISAAVALKEASLGGAVGKLARRHQRVRNGWDSTALWSLDGHLTTTLSTQLAHLADIAHGWPAGDEFPEFEDWQTALYEQAAKLALYAAHDSGDLDRSEQLAAIEAGQEALRWVADHLPQLWD
jgi:hypothetical protein